MRVRGQLDLFEAADVSVVGMNEVERNQVGPIEESPLWDYIMVTPNLGHVGGVPGNWMGNIIAFRSDRLDVVAKKDIPFSMGSTRHLHSPAATFRDKATGVEFSVVGTHFPRMWTAGTPERRLSLSTRTAGVEAQLAYVEEQKATGHQTFVVGDLNSHSLDNTYKDTLVVGVQADIDWVLGVTGIEFTGPVVAPTNRTTDHKTWGYVDATVHYKVEGR